MENMHSMHVLYPHMHYMHGGIYKRVKEEGKRGRSINQASYVLNQELNINKNPNYLIGDV